MKTVILILLAPLLLASSTSLRAQSADWQVVPGDYASTMNVIGRVLLDGQPLGDPGDGLAAFVGEQVRGVAYPIEVGGEWLYFLTVYANGDGETVVFKSYEAATGAIRRIDETVLFQADTVTGTVATPVVMHAGAVDTGAPAWIVEPSAFGASMTVTATVTVEGRPSTREDDLAAFVGESVRGVAIPVTFNGQVVFFLTVYANATGEAVRFRFYEAGAGVVHEVNETLVFETNTFHGSVQAPLALTIGGVASPTATERLDGALPTAFSLAQNYPNPFNPETTLLYAVPSDAHVTVTVHNMLGETVATLVDARQGAGRYAVRFDGEGLPSGVYLYRLQAGAFHAARSMLLIK